MFLRSLEIENYRSLEQVELTDIGRFNVLIGRNNAGKSSVFGILALLWNVLNGSVSVDWRTLLTDKDENRSLQIKLTFEPRVKDRKEFINILNRQGPWGDREETIFNSPLLRQIEFSFMAPPGSPNRLLLRQTRILAQDNKWALVQSTEGQTGDKPISKIARVGQAFIDTRGSLEAPLLSIQYRHNEVRITPAYMTQGQFDDDKAAFWVLTSLGRYLSRAFFFNPFRHSAARLPVQQADHLTQDGSNLAQVLHTIQSNNRLHFLSIEKFLHGALPDLGILQTPLSGNDTEVSFRSSKGDYLVRLHDMGGGIEQLLMIAVVLLTTNDDSTLFIEEPESHLHAGAQQFLLERLYQGERQVFLTTHSPTFVNINRPKSLYLVKLGAGRTAVTHSGTTDSLSIVLEDIGSKNSDVLLSDAVLFVEGPSDRKVLSAWSGILDSSLEEHNVTSLVLEGGANAARFAPVQSDVLIGISQKAPVPHLFVIDRDERSKPEVEKLKKALDGKIHILLRRELENYLLVPRVLLEAIRSKLQDGRFPLDKITAATEEEIKELIRKTADGLYGLVLVKRIRAEVSGPSGGLLPRESIAKLVQKAKDVDLSNALQQEIEEQLKEYLSSLDLEKSVNEHRKKLDQEWSDPLRHLEVAPGEEILGAIFQYYGTDYQKPNDAVRIAKLMHADEIPEEIRELIKKVVAMTGRVS
jgi:predicted ATP-dependent endonuclease of OLD family